MRKTEIMKEIAENGEREKIVKVKKIEGQHVEETTVQKGYVNISEILVNNGMKSKEMADKDKINIGLKKREST